MTIPLEDFVIVIDGKKFIKCDNPTVRADFKWEKFKPARYIMAENQIVEELTDELVEALFGNTDLSKEDLHNIIWGIVDNKLA